MPHRQTYASGFLHALLGALVWLPVAASLVPAADPPGGEPQGPGVPPGPLSVQFKLSEVEAQPGEAVNVPMLVNADAPLSMVAFSAEYDPRILDLVGPVISSEVISILVKNPGAQWELTWFTSEEDPSEEEGWIQVSLVVDYLGREELTLPSGRSVGPVSLNFKVQPDAPRGRYPVSFTRPDSARYGGHFQAGDVAVYNSVRRHGRPFTPENRFSDPMEPDLEDGAVVVAIIGDIGIFLRGDANIDRQIDVSDPVSVIEFLFLGRESLPCDDAADANDDGRIDISDPVTLLEYLFMGGTASTVSVDSVKDETQDSLGCSYY